MIVIKKMAGDESPAIFLFNKKLDHIDLMKKRYKITCRNGNTVTVNSLREAKEICIHLHLATTITDQNGKRYQ